MNAYLLSISVLLLLSQCTVVQSARILGLFPFPGKSHYILGSALMRALAEDGHEVTVVSTFGEKEPPKNAKYKDIVITEIQEQLENQKQDINMFEMEDSNPFIIIPFITYFMSNFGEWILQDKVMQELILSKEKFDAVIIEQFFFDSLKVLAPHFDAVQIVFNSHGANFWVDSLVGNPSPVSYIPDVFLSYSADMTFCERLTNTLVYLLNTVAHHGYLYPKQKAVAQKHIPNAVDFYDVLYNTSLVLLNSHPSLNRPVPHVPNMIEIGGFHIKPPKTLPTDLQQFLDTAEDGVIYFSMGSNLRSADLPAEKRDAILRTFAKLKQKVLWKWEEDILPGQPKNVKLGKWLPQQDILAHPNVKLFITHGGLLSSTEATYFGVPILAIPIYGDQKMNAQQAVSNGIGLSLSYQDLNEETLSKILDQLLHNPQYHANAKSKSNLFHDREVKPIDTALYWVDYVIRHKGAPHLRVAGVGLPWYKYYLLDVISLIAAVVTAGTFITIFVTKKILQKFCNKKCQKKVKKN